MRTWSHSDEEQPLTVIEYVTEEVWRQGHDVTQVDGIERVGWMLHAWIYAWLRAKGPDSKPNMADVIRLGQMVEPLRNPDGLRTCNVRVGVSVPAEWQRVPELLRALFEARDQLTPMEFYKEFENIHPFTDGNGRTGRILLNWLNGTLFAPIFPPHDLFGEPIRNP